MNIHIELVKQWLADPESVTVEELNANSEAARYADDAARAANAAAIAAWEAVDAAAYAAAAATANSAADTVYWVNRYEELTDE